MATLDDLLNSSLANQIMTPEQKQARIQEILNGTLPGAMRQYGANAQAINENAFGRGMGLSTWNAYQQALQTLMQNEGIANIQNQARNQVEQAQNAAIGQAASVANARNAVSAQQNIASQRNRLEQHLADQRARQALTQLGIQGGAQAGFGVGGLLGRGLTAKPGTEGSLGNMYQNAKGNLGFGEPQIQPMPSGADLTGGGGLNAGDVGAAGSMAGANAPSYSMPSLETPSFSGGNYGGDYGLGSLPSYTYTDPGSWDLSNLFSDPNTGWY